MLSRELAEQLPWFLSEFDRGLLFYYVGNGDLISHMMWRSMDPEHPTYDAETDAPYADVIPQVYEEMDALVTYTLDHMGDDTLLIVTATNAFVTAPIARRFGIENLIATDPEIDAGRYTGRVSGEPSFREGKVVRLRAWLAGRQQSLDDSWFYSDSHNDLPLLELVDNPVAVDPDEMLGREANNRGWPVISLR